MIRGLVLWTLNTAAKEIMRDVKNGRRQVEFLEVTLRGRTDCGTQSAAVGFEKKKRPPQSLSFIRCRIAVYGTRHEQ